MVPFNIDLARGGASVILNDGTHVECVFTDDNEYPVSATWKTDYGTETIHFTRDGISHPNAGRKLRLYMDFVQQELTLF